MVLRFKLFPPRCRCAIQRAVPVKTLPLLKGVSTEEAKGVFGHVENIIAFAKPYLSIYLRLKKFFDWNSSPRGRAEIR